MTFFSYNVPEFLTRQFDWDLGELEKMLVKGERDSIIYQKNLND